MSHQPTPPLEWERRPLAELLRLSWPTVISLLSVSAMSLIDTLFIGRLGAVALAAAGLGGVSVFTVISFSLAVFGTAKVKIGESHGAGDRAAVKRSLGALLRLALALGALSVVLGQLAGSVLPLLSADVESGVLAGRYTALRSLGFPLILLSTAIGHWLQAQGDAKSAMRAALAANAANVPLNVALIYGLGLGVEGAALATAASRLVEAFWLVHRRRRTAVIRGSGSATAPGFHWHQSNWAEALTVLRVGIPTGLERVLDMIAFSAVPLLLSQTGPVEVAAHQVVLQLMLFSFLPLFALNDAVSVLVAQAIGAGRSYLVRRLNHLGLTAALSYAALYGVVCLLQAPYLIATFTPDVEVIDAGAQALAVAALAQLLNAAFTHFKGILRGLSAFRYVAWITVGCAWLVTPPLTYWIGVREGHGAVGAWWALCVEVTCGVPLLGWRIVRDPIYGASLRR